ncbi:MAG: hypothetical protein C0595_13090 [Marinilabiliales bacterium]|nr:MAG: hypothetical protein C0595_13090 [Marinilabiliales bacterium]
MRSQQISETAKTEDNRFITQVDASPIDVKLKDRTELVEQITLGIEWWTLLKEPTYKYLFRWRKGSRVFSSAYTTYLSESLLQKYPDLLKRYNQLKPTYIELELSVIFDFGDTFSNEKQNAIKSLPECFRKEKEATFTDRTYYELTDLSGKLKVNSNTHFYISSKDKTGDDLSPGSPKDWTEFVMYNCAIDNTAGYSIFKNSESATFSIEIVKIEVPQREIDAIAKEFFKRENAKDDVAEKKDNKKKKVNNWNETPSPDDNGGSKDNGSNNSWDNDDKSSNSWDNIENSNNKDKQNSDNDSNNWDNSESEKSGWELPADSEKSGKESYEVRYDGNKQGVYDKLNDLMLIPFGDYQIIEYKPEEKMAKVSIAAGSEEKYTSSDCYKKRVKITVRKYDIGYIGRNGKWILEPKKTISFYDNFNAPMVSLVSADCDYDCRKRAERDRIRNNKKCYRLIEEKEEEIKSYYKSIGYEIE